MISLDGSKKIIPEGATIEADFLNDSWIQFQSNKEKEGFVRIERNYRAYLNVEERKPGDVVILRSGIILFAT